MAGYLVGHRAARTRLGRWSRRWHWRWGWGRLRCWRRRRDRCGGRGRNRRRSWCWNRCRGRRWNRIRIYGDFPLNSVASQKPIDFAYIQYVRLGFGDARGLVGVLGSITRHLFAIQIPFKAVASAAFLHRKNLRGAGLKGNHPATRRCIADTKCCTWQHHCQQD